MNDLPYAEGVNYFRTSKSSASTWLARARAEIMKVGGAILAYGSGFDIVHDRAAHMLAFQIGVDKFKLVWPVLPSKSGDERAAEIQAATMLYHDVKARCVSAKVLGGRAAFFSYLMLPGGRTLSELATPELLEALPTFLRPALPAGEEAADAS